MSTTELDYVDGGPDFLLYHEIWTQYGLSWPVLQRAVRSGQLTRYRRRSPRKACFRRSEIEALVVEIRRIRSQVARLDPLPVPEGQDPLSWGPRRFEILERDGFACRYCGRRPPKVELEVDHIVPRSRGGTSDRANLITACFDCNRAKRSRAVTLPE